MCYNQSPRGLRKILTLSLEWLDFDKGTDRFCMGIWVTLSLSTEYALRGLKIYFCYLRIFRKNEIPKKRMTFWKSGSEIDTFGSKRPKNHQGMRS